MTVQKKGLMLGAALATLAGFAPSVLAADFGQRETYQDMGRPAGVPVPAPVPIPDYKPSFYFRFDAGVGITDEPDISDTSYLIEGIGDDPELGTPASWFRGDFDTFLTVGGGVGYYVGNGFRIDATIEKRSNDQAYIGGEIEGDTYAYDTTGTYALIDANGNGDADTRSRLTVDDRTDVDGTVWMANAYYDIQTGHNFTPYIGAGVGFVWHQLTRSRTETLETCDSEGGTCANGGFVGTYTQNSTATASDKADKVSFAAAAMAGFSYDISDMTAIDIGYRYLYLQGTDAVLDIGTERSTVEIGDQHVHQIRAGVRFNVD